MFSKFKIFSEYNIRWTDEMDMTVQIMKKR